MDIREIIDRLLKPETLYTLAALIPSFVFHEIAHAVAGNKLGDPTSRKRITLNPLKHIDPIGFLLIVFAGFGWAKPVMIDPRNFKNPKRDMAIVSIAGPLSNFVLVLFAAAVLRVMVTLSEFNQAADILWDFFVALLQINIGLGIFNLLPFPPLDGSKIFAALLPDRIYNRYMQFERYGMIVLLVLLYFGFANGVLSWLIQHALDFVFNLFRFPGY